MHVVLKRRSLYLKALNVKGSVGCKEYSFPKFGVLMNSINIHMVSFARLSTFLKTSAIGL